MCGIAAGCNGTQSSVVAGSPELSAAAETPAEAGGAANSLPDGRRRHLGNAYQIAGRWYKPEEDPDYDRVGTASWYGARFQGRLTANGEVFDRTALSAAHPTLPLPSYVRVTNLENSRSVMVRVNDRGPFSDGRLIDVSEQTAELLGFKQNGMAQVRVEYVDKAKLDGDDQAMLLASYRDVSDDPAYDPRILLALAERPSRTENAAPIIMASLQAAERPASERRGSIRAAADALQLPRHVTGRAAAPAKPMPVATTAPVDRIDSAFAAIGAF